MQCAFAHIRNVPVDQTAPFLITMVKGSAIWGDGRVGWLARTAIALVAVCTAMGTAQAQPDDTVGTEADGSVSLDRAIVNLLKDRLRNLPPGIERRLVDVPARDVFFPVDSLPADAATLRAMGYTSIQDSPRLTSKIEEHYLAQIPDDYNDLPRLETDKVRVLYLRTCNRYEAVRKAAMQFRSEAVEDGDIAVWHVEQANFELALEAVAGSDLDAGEDLAQLFMSGTSSSSGISDDNLRKLNRLLVRALTDDKADADTGAQALPVLVLRGPCVTALSPVKSLFPGLITIPPLPVPVGGGGYAYAPPKYFAVSWPVGASQVLVGRGIEGMLCSQRSLPWESSKCGFKPAGNRTALAARAIGRHVFVARIGSKWARGQFDVSGAVLFGENLPPGQMPVITLMPDP